MTRAIINTGTFANDGTGDTLRAAADKINSNFLDLYSALGDPNNAFVNISFGDRAVVFEDASSFTTTLTSNGSQPENITITLPDSTGVVTLNAATQTLTNKTLDSTTLITPFILDSDASNTFKIVGSDISSNKVVRIPNLVGLDSSTLVFADLEQTLTDKTLDSATLNTPTIDEIQTSGNTVMSFGAGGTNYLGVAVNGSTPTLQATGGANVNLQLRSPGTGKIELRDGSFGANELATLEVGKLSTSGQQALQFDKDSAIVNSSPVSLDTNYMINVLDSVSPLGAGFIANINVGNPNSVRYIVNNTSFNATLTLVSGGKFEDLSSTKVIPPRECYKFVVATDTIGANVRNWFKVT